MTFRVSTYTTSSGIFNNSQRLQTNYAKVSLQSSSGLKSENFQGISGDAQKLLTLVGESNNLTGQALAIKGAQNRIAALQNITSTISDTLNNVTSLLTNVQSGLDITGSSATFVAQAVVLRDAIVAALNTKVGGAYLFSGSVYDKPPVDITNAGYTPTISTASTGYYEGDSVLDSVRTSDSQRITYGVSANNPAYENALRALTIFINNPTNPATIAAATDLNRAAIDGNASIQGELLAKANVVATASELNATTIAYLTDTISSVRDVDAAAAAVQMSQIETQLQASYGGLSKLLTLRLTDYLR